MEKQAKAKEYNRKKIILSVVEFIIAITFICLLLFSGFSLNLREILGAKIVNPYLLFLAFSFILGIGENILSLPLDFYGGYVLEHKYNLSNQTVLKWIGEKLKSFGVGIILFTPLLLVFYFFIRWTQNLWWFYTGATFFLFSVILARIAPILIFPLFYKFKPIDNPELEMRLREAAKRVRLKIQGLFKFDLSKNTKKANAALAGIGKSRRIIIGDTLIENFSPQEIESVFCHELGHHKYKHIVKQMALGTFFTFGGLYLTNLGITKTVSLFQRINPGYGGLDDAAFLPLFALFLCLYGLITMPVRNIISRKFEYESDSYSVREGPGRDVFISAMEKLAEQNLADKDPHPLIEFLFHSHPSIIKRISAALNLTPESKT
ncbi:MAG: M48 family metallopeptidase [bacterium]